MNSIPIFAVISVLLNCGFSDGRLSSVGNEGNFLPLPAPPGAEPSAEGDGGKIDIVNSNSGSAESGPEESAESGSAESHSVSVESHTDSKSHESSKEDCSKSECQEDSSESSEEFDGCCEDGWTQNEDKCYRAFEEPVPYNNYVCNGLKGFVYSVKSFDTASEYRFLKSNIQLGFGEVFGQSRQEVIRRKNMANFVERMWDGNARNVAFIWTNGRRNKGLCYRAFNEMIKSYEEPIKCEEHGAKHFVIMSAAVDKFAVESLEKSNKYSRYDYNSGMQRGYLCMMISTNVVGKNRKLMTKTKPRRKRENGDGLFEKNIVCLIK